MKVGDAGYFILFIQVQLNTPGLQVHESQAPQRQGVEHCGFGSMLPFGSPIPHSSAPQGLVNGLFYGEKHGSQLT